MPRIFIVDSRQIPDPAPELPVDDPKAPLDIKRSLAVFFPELSTSTHTQRVEGETTYVEFRKTVGTKG